MEGYCSFGISGTCSVKSLVKKNYQKNYSPFIHFPHCCSHFRVGQNMQSFAYIIIGLYKTFLHCFVESYCCERYFGKFVSSLLRLPWRITLFGPSLLRFLYILIGFRTNVISLRLRVVLSICTQQDRRWIQSVN
jgi:uncharacterized membrane protein YuzA (DUF378 family)